MVFSKNKKFCPRFSMVPREFWLRLSCARTRLTTNVAYFVVVFPPFSVGPLSFLVTFFNPVPKIWADRTQLALLSIHLHDHLPASDEGAKDCKQKHLLYHLESIPIFSVGGFIDFWNVITGDYCRWEHKILYYLGRNVTVISCYHLRVFKFFPLKVSFIGFANGTYCLLYP